jgi:hypothetical protein
MTRFTVGYHAHGDEDFTILRQSIEATTVHEAAVAFQQWTIRHGQGEAPIKLWIGDLHVWDSDRGDYDQVSHGDTADDRSTPIWTAETVSDFFQRTPAKALWSNRCVAVKALDPSGEKRVAWTSMRAMLHLEEMGAVTTVWPRIWHSRTLSAHQRLALPAALRAIRARDAAIRGTA